MSTSFVIFALLLVTKVIDAERKLLPTTQRDLQLLRSTNGLSSSRNLGDYISDTVVDGLETSYDEYSQAWRMLGMYIDCGDNDEVVGSGQGNSGGGAAAAGRRRRRQQQQQQLNRRAEQADAEAADGDEAAAADEDAAADEQAADEYNDVQMDCKRYLLWAAYVDLDYEGNGINEYQIYNPHEGKWNKTMCNDKGRCARMDCHLPNSRFKLLGFFKEEYPLVFLKTLATYQGSCTWKDGNGDSASMDTILSWFPSGCVQSKTPIADGSAYNFYMDIQPTYAGSVNVGLYTDLNCVHPYTYPKDTAHSITSVLNTYYGYETDASTAIQSFNSMLDDFKVCQPCHTYDMSNTADADGDSDSDYVCVDAAGNNGINMCSAFATQTTISKASFHDLEKASSQTTIVRTYSKSDITSSWWQRWGFLLISSIVFVIGNLCFCSVAIKRKRTTTKRKLLSSSSQDKDQPLIYM